MEEGNTSIKYMETIIKTADSIKVVEMQEVVKEEYKRDELEAELEAVLSEIKNYDIIVANRLGYLNARKLRLQTLLSNK